MRSVDMPDPVVGVGEKRRAESEHRRDHHGTRVNDGDQSGGGHGRKCSGSITTYSNKGKGRRKREYRQNGDRLIHEPEGMSACSVASIHCAEIST